MLDTLLNILLFLSIIINIFFLLIIAINYYSDIWPGYRTNAHKSTSTNPPTVSILIPVRNEEKNLPITLPTLESLEYQSVSTFILEDNSTDKSFQLLQNFKQAQTTKNIHIFKGKPLPEGWLGKAYALYQLQKEEKQNENSEILIFTDADDIFSPWVIETTVQLMNKHELDMLSLFPQQRFSNISERIFNPITDIILFSLLPLSLVRKTSFSSLAAANGQWIAIKRNVYDKLGGHEAVHNRIVEDTEIARLAKERGFRVGVFSGMYLISTRMYDSISNSFEGFTKNLYGIAGNNSFALITISAMYTVAGILPFILLTFPSLYPAAMLPLLIMLLWRGMLAEKLRHGIIAVFMFPVTSLFIFITAISSFLKVPHGKAVWKGRTL